MVSHAPHLLSDTLIELFVGRRSKPLLQIRCPTLNSVIFAISARCCKHRCDLYYQQDVAPWCSLGNFLLERWNIHEKTFELLGENTVGETILSLPSGLFLYESCQSARHSTGLEQPKSFRTYVLAQYLRRRVRPS